MADERVDNQDCVIDDEYYPLMKDSISTINEKLLDEKDNDAKEFRQWVRDSTKEKELDSLIKAMIGIHTNDFNHYAWIVELWMIDKGLYSNNFNGEVYSEHIPLNELKGFDDICGNEKWKMLGANIRQSKEKSILSTIRKLKNQLRDENFIYIPKANNFMGVRLRFDRDAGRAITRYCKRKKVKNYFEVTVDDYLTNLEKFISLNVKVLKRERIDTLEEKRFVLKIDKILKARFDYSLGNRPKKHILFLLRIRFPHTSIDTRKIGDFLKS